ncbi:hypothetical protein Tsubulata_015185 [Turnera subulata]|uniref:Ninja-family protein n=1 Tax=Turnera subulata TaxID=218843 RepID=A0A9Q0F8J8_9ROSI|nr:hypothetical protein Tsubulata_015185 [Turnera subulata]
MAQADRFQSIDGQQQQQQQQQQVLRMFLENGLSKDLLQSFMPGNPLNLKLHEGVEEEEGDIELSLGLSLNGRFGVDPRAKKLTRSSSIPDFINPTRENGSALMGPGTSSNLVRTCSLPTETEDQWRKRKEVQMQRRMEVKRKRLEKKSNSKAVKDMIKASLEENGEEDKRENGNIGNHHERRFQNFNGVLGGTGVDELVPGAELAAPVLHGSIGSQGSGSSGITDSETQPVQGMNKCTTEARSPTSVQTLSECEQKSMITPRVPITPAVSGSLAGAKAESNGCNKPKSAGKRTKEEMVRDVLEEMPCVSTKGDGPSGKRIEGFLYRFRKGEEVRIVCVCHGNFLSPAEFVKHAGGGDVAQPLKHIVVNPSPLL